MKEYAFEHLKLMMLDKAATVVQAMIRGNIARIQHQKLKVQFTYNLWTITQDSYVYSMSNT